MVMIREAAIEDIEVLSRIISESFNDVAKRFSLTQDNCPKHPSNCTASWIESDMVCGVHYFILSEGWNSFGCVGIESPDDEVCYLLKGKIGNGISVLLRKRPRAFHFFRFVSVSWKRT
jgi:hypothetical protein